MAFLLTVYSSICLQGLRKSHTNTEHLKHKVYTLGVKEVYTLGV